MSNLFRHHYAPGELETATGPVPTFGNPGALTNHTQDTHANRECSAHGVRWRGDDDCWLCASEEN